MADKDDNSTPEKQETGPAPMPLYGGVVDGIQAYRRGEDVVYSVQGRPEDVRQLLDLLERDGVEDVVALISHRPPEEAIVTEARADDE